MTDKPDGTVTPVDHPILTLHVGWADGGGMVYACMIGDGQTPVTTIEPWMLEAIIVAQHALEQTRNRVERMVLTDFLEKGRQQREARKKFAEVGGVTEGEKETLN